MSWIDTDQFVEIDGQKYAKTPDFMAPGGQYEGLKKNYDEKEALAAIPLPPPPSAFDAFDPSKQVNPFNSAMNAQVTGAMPPLPPPPPAGAPLITSPVVSPEQGGVITAPPGAGAVGQQPMSRGPMDLESSTTTSQFTSPQTMRELNQAGKSISDGLRSESLAQQDVDAATSMAAIASQMQSKRFMEEEQLIAQKEQLRGQEFDARILEADEKYKTANIDSSRLWRDSSTGSKIAAGVGVMLGALGQALTGKDNPALKIIEAAINRDVDIQEKMMDKAGKDVAQAKGAYADYRRATGDNRAARAAMHVMALQNVKLGLDVQAAKSADPLTAARFQQQAAKVDLSIAEKKAEINSTKVVKTKEQVAPKVGAAPVAQFDQSVNDKMDPIVRTLTGFTDVIDAFEKPQVRESTGVINSYVNSLKNQFGLEVDPTWLETDTLTGQVQRTLLKQMSGSGVSEGERNMYKKIMSSVSQHPENALALARQFLRDKQKEYTETKRGAMGRYLGNNSAIHSTYPDLVDNAKLGFKED